MLVKIALILGIVVMTRSVKVRPSWLNRDGVIMLLAVVLLLFFVWTNDGLQDGKGDSCLPLCRLHRLAVDETGSHSSRGGPESGDTSTGIKLSSAAYLIMIFVGLACSLCCKYLGEQAYDLALKLNVPHSVVGTTVSGIGTSLRNSIALMAAKRSKGVAIGTLIGSNITDPLLSVGIASMIHPLSISPEDNGLTMDIIAPATVLGVLLALFFMRRTYRFERWEGTCLVLFYAIFLVVLQLNR